MSTNLNAQQPAYFKIGEEDLKNVDIYSLHQGADEIIYAGTDIGLLVYKHGKFIEVEKATEQIGSSVFELKRNNKGELFCCNLNGQIFKLVNNKLELFYSIPKEKVGSWFSFYFDSNDNILIKGKVLMKLFTNENNRLKIYHRKKGTGYLMLAGVMSNEHHYYTTSSNEVWEYKHGELKKPAKLNDVFKNHLIVGILPSDSEPIFIYSKENERRKFKVKSINDLIDTRGIDFDLTREPISFNETEFCTISRNKGIDFFQMNKNTILNKKTWFPKQFISTISQTEDGKLLLGTFKKGIIIIPNRNIFDENIVPKDEICQGICSNGDSLYFTTKSNKIYSFIDGLTKLEQRHSSKYALLNIIYIKGFDYFKERGLYNLLYDDIVRSSIYKGRFNSLKDAWQKPNNEILIASSTGLTLYSKNQKINKKYWMDKLDNFYLSRNISGRVKSVCYDPLSATIYISKGGTLFAVDSIFNKEPVLYQEREINSNDLFFKDSILYIASQNQGVLILKNGKVSPKYNTENGLGNNYIQKIKIVGKQLFLSHLDGFQVIDLETDEIITIGKAEGLSDNIVSDFDVDGHKLWLLSNNKIRSIDTRNLPKLDEKIHMYFDSLVVNDKRVDINLKRKFSYQEKRFDFHLDFRKVVLEEETKFKYKLEGFDENWISTRTKDHIISYKALIPGNYTFKVYAQYRNYKSDEFEYSFKIKAPFWQQWWFYVSLIISMSTIFYFFYKNRMNQVKQLNKIALEKEKAEREKQTAEKEMIESELKALRSQMNPHFIFNSLNSIQDLILKEETDKSYDYIVLFADLVRSTLNHSNMKFIPVEKELDFLNVYLSLEKLRFKDDLNYEINYNGSKDIEVPSLLVQPFIENSLLHGLLHKKGKKELKINFETKEGIFICTILDNGIGREKSKKIRQRQRIEHKSFSMAAIKKRLDFFSFQFNINAYYEFTDLHKEGYPSGTKVEIHMPLKNIF